VFLGSRRLETLLTEAAELGIKSISWTGGGDPSLHPSIGAAITKAEMLGFKQGMFTNALAIPKYNPDLLEWIRVTVTDRPVNVEYVRMLRRCKTLGFAFNYAGSQDLDRLIETLDIAEQVGADYVQTRPALKPLGQKVFITPPPIRHRLLESTAYKFEDAAKPHGYESCVGWNFFPYISEDGKVWTCAYHQKTGAPYLLGDVYQDTLAKILERAPLEVPVCDRCQIDCKPHEANKAVHAARQLQDVCFP
jgi:MoaA/NifB/PqqE/SkfB family radical SAM enzyme